MRLTSRFVGLALVILAAFWFAAANAGRIVLVDLVLFRLRIALPLLVFGSVLFGMGVSFFVGWRAERKERLAAVAEPARLGEPRDYFESGLHEFDTVEQERRDWH